MKVAVVAESTETSRRVIARLGMVGKATPLALGVTPLSGHYFTAVLRIPTSSFTSKDQSWWTDLLARTKGPVFRLEEE